jgi:hypothetical protein
MDTIELMLEHDAWMTGRMLERAEGLDAERLDRPVTISAGVEDVGIGNPIGFGHGTDPGTDLGTDPGTDPGTARPQR